MAREKAAVMVLVMVLVMGILKAQKMACLMADEKASVTASAMGILKA